MTNLQSLSIFLTERLMLAAQEIFKAVEVTVTEYHDEISRFKEENELLKSKLVEAGIHVYPELDSGLSVFHGEPCGSNRGDPQERIHVKHEPSASREQPQVPPSPSPPPPPPQTSVPEEPVSPPACLEDDPRIEEMLHPQLIDSSVSPSLQVHQCMQIKEESDESKSGLRAEMFCMSQSATSDDPSSTIANNPAGGLDIEMDGLSSMHNDSEQTSYDWLVISREMDGENDLASFIKSTLPTLRESQHLLKVLEEFGVHDLEDLDYVQEIDLLHVLKPVEVRKLLSRFKTTRQRIVLDIPSSNQRSSYTNPETQPDTILTSGGYSIASSNSHISTFKRCSSSGFTRRQLSDNNWHFNFEIPWDKMPSEFTRKLDKGKRPTKSERLEIIRLIISEILPICSAPGKKHLSEIARKMAKAYPVAFTDIIEGEIVGSGYDSLTKQLVSRVDNLRRGNTSLSFKRRAVSTSEGEYIPPRRRRLDTYGCINWQPMQLPPDETVESQRRAQDELKKMYKKRCHDATCVETMMRLTFFTQRRDIIAGIETSDLITEWPYLFEVIGMKSHYKELTGMDIDDSAIANKYVTVVSYFKSNDKTGKMGTIFREMETSSKNVVDVNAAGFLLLLLKYFSEEEDQMFHTMDKKTLPSDVDCTELPSTPCIILCGSSPFTAEHFMLSVDQTIVNGHIAFFSDAVVLMFASYYSLNISYPAALGATLEFLQRCIFKINTDKGSKVEKTSKKQHAVSPKVLSLITKIADYEWRE